MIGFVTKLLFGRSHRQLKGAPRRGQRPTRRSRPTVRALEDRTLLSAGAFLQGTAFIDLHHDATLHPNDPYLAGATISLYQGPTAAGVPLATTTTDTNGAYLFSDTNVPTSYGSAGLNPGVYTLVETPPAGVVNTGTQVLSQLNPATSVNSSTVQVTLVDPSNLYLGFNSTVFFNRHAWDLLQETVLGGTAKESAGQFPIDAFGSLTPVLTFGGAGVTNNSAKITLSNTAGLSVGQFVKVTDGVTTLYSPIRSITANTSITLQDKWTGSAGNTATVGLLGTVNSPFLTLCWDLQHFLADGTNIFQVTPTSGQGNPTNAGEIAYLYNHYGTVDIKDAAADNAVLSQATVPVPALATGSIAEAVGLQVAIWELEYGANFSGLQVLKRDGNTTPAVLAQELSDINTWANFYTQDAAGKSEVATFLQVTGGAIQGGQQGLLATGSYNFANLGQPLLATTASQTAGGVVGTAVVSDSATLSGGFQVGGGAPAPTITFQLIAPDGTTAYTETQTVTGTGTYTTTGTGTGSELATQVGLYYWVVSYSGNAFNSPVTDNGLTDVTEQVTTLLAGPTLTTTASQTAGGVVGTAVVSDSATLSGGFQVGAGAPAPTITFQLVAPDGTTAYTETQTVTGTGTYTTTGTGTGSELATQVGLYYWVVNYSGNAFNSPVTDNGLTDVTEQVTTAQATPALTTTASQTAGGVVGTAVVSDSATLSGGFQVGAGAPAPTITFQLIAPDGTTAYTETQTVTGTGTYTTTGTGTGSELATQVGLYYWVVSYSGNALNGAVTDNGLNDVTEQVTTIAAPTSADLRIAKTDNVGGTFSAVTNNTTGGRAIPGQTVVTYTIVVTNDGPDAAVNQTVSDVFPAALRNVSWTGSDGSHGTGTLTDTIASLAAGASVTYTVTATINPAATGNVVNTTTVTAPNGDTTPADNTSTDTIALIPSADLAVTKRSPFTAVWQGSSTYFTMTVTNLGPSTVTAFYLVDTLPKGFLNATFRASTGHYNPVTHRWSGLNLTKGHSITLTVYGTVSLYAVGPLVNFVRISPPPNRNDSSFFVDSNLRNNVAQASVAVLALSKRFFI